MSEKLIIPDKGPLANLIRFAGLQNVRILTGPPNVGTLPAALARDMPIGLSALGTAVFSDLTLMGCTYSDTSQPQKPDGTYPLITLPNDRFRTGSAGSSQTGNAQPGGFYMNIQTVIMRISQHIDVVTTTIQGAPPGAGEVDEYIGMPSARININGILTSTQGVYPKDDAARLKVWLDAPVSKGIVAAWLHNLGIYNIVVLDYELPQMEGEYSQQYFKIDCKGSFPVQLRVTVPIQSTN